MTTELKCQVKNKKCLRYYCSFHINRYQYEYIRMVSTPIPDTNIGIGASLAWNILLCLHVMRLYHILVDLLRWITEKHELLHHVQIFQVPLVVVVDTEKSYSYVMNIL